MPKSYSIAEAKNHFTELVRDVENDSPIQLTRRGKPVAVLLSTREYDRLQKGKVDFWTAYLAFRERLEREGIELDIDEIYADVRDLSAPTEPRL
jgi:prevent-host-death family protein